MNEIKLRTLRPDEWNEVAKMIHDSTNDWYEQHLGRKVFEAGPDPVRVFCEVYEELDPGRCLIAECPATGQILGSCFYHPRETHFSLGIMNAAPRAFGRGVARRLLTEIIHQAREANLPVRLVSSAVNIDSFSLYTRAGFVPRQWFQDMLFEIPEEGIVHKEQIEGVIRAATVDDVTEMGSLEMAVGGIRREQDYRYFIANRLGCWKTLVYESDGLIRGWLTAIEHPNSRRVGPGVAANPSVAVDLLANMLNRLAGRAFMFMAPVESSELIQTAYRWGARNCELNVCQVLGDFRPFNGVVIPSFLPETA